MINKTSIIKRLMSNPFPKTEPVNHHENEIKEIYVNEFCVTIFPATATIDTLKNLLSGQLLQLKPEPDNPRGLYAVNVMNGNIKIGSLLGYENKHIYSMLKQNIELRGRLSRLDCEDKPAKHFWIKIWIILS